MEYRRQQSCIQDLVGLVRTHHPKFVFLSETRQPTSRLESLRWRLGLTVASSGMSGGIALLWDESIKVTLLGMSSRFIDVLVRDNPDATCWRATFVYGKPRVENRHLMWELLKRMRKRSILPWFVAGDFNEALWQFEHFLATRRSEREMEDFRETLADCNLHDIGFMGLPWTYDNKQSGHRNVKVRLDRAVVSSDWSALFPEARVEHLVSPCSDHCSLLITMTKDEINTRVVKRGRYEAMWERESSIDQVVSEAWSREVKQSLGDISLKLQEVMVSLKNWSHEKFGSVRKELEKLRCHLVELSKDGGVDKQGEIKATSAHMNELLYREELLWM